MLKKHKYLLTGLLMMAGIVNLNSQEVYAGKVSELNINNVEGSPKLEWSTEMYNDEILYQTGFEEHDSQTVDLDISSVGPYKNLHSLSPLAAFNGNRGYLLNDNSNGKGATGLSYGTDYHAVQLGTIYGHTDIPIIATFKAKSIGYTDFYLGGDGGYENYLYNLNVKAVRNHAVGEKVLYLDSVTGLNLNQTLFLDDDANTIEHMYQIKSIDKTNKTVTLYDGITKELKSGENLKERDWVYSFDFDGLYLDNSDWKSYTLQNYLTESDYYDTATRGVSLFTYIGTDGQFMMDNLKVGYATEVEVFRNGTSIYKGYLNQFHDTSLKDTIAPDRVISAYAYKNNDNIMFNIDKPKDNGVQVKYQIKTTVSDKLIEKNFTLTTDVQSYNYEISNNVVPSNLSNSSISNSLNISTNDVNVETDYLHIQAVDGEGNVSEISTFKISEIMGSANNNSQYQQDILLRLLKGDFALLVRDTISFGPVRLTASKQTITVPLGSNIGIIDARGTQQGWKLNVSATPFTEDTFEGFVGETTQLPLGTLSLGSIETLNQVADIDNVQYPSTLSTNTNVIDSGEVTFLEANKGEGMGQFDLDFGDNALSIVVDSSTAKIDDLNYPTGMTPYTSTITWNLVTGP